VGKLITFAASELAAYRAIEGEILLTEDHRRDRTHADSYEIHD
jgi:hypothetical protein